MYEVYLVLEYLYQYDIRVKFEFSDKSLHTKIDYERRQTRPADNNLKLVNTLNYLLINCISVLKRKKLLFTLSNINTNLGIQSKRKIIYLLYKEFISYGKFKNKIYYFNLTNVYFYLLLEKRPDKNY